MRIGQHLHCQKDYSQHPKVSTGSQILGECQNWRVNKGKIADLDVDASDSKVLSKTSSNQLGSNNETKTVLTSANWALLTICVVSNCFYSLFQFNSILKHTVLSRTPSSSKESFLVNTQAFRSKNLSSFSRINNSQKADRLFIYCVHFAYKWQWESFVST